MKRAVVLAGLALLWSQRGNAAQVKHQISISYLPGQDYAGLFLPSVGATLINAIVHSDVRGTAFFDVSNNKEEERDTVFGLVAQTLIPQRAMLIAVPPEFLGFQWVRLRFLNQDQTFGRVRATLTVWRP